MSTLPTVAVVIPQGCEEWKGQDSLPRVQDLMAVGVTKRAIAKRFRISVTALDNALNKAKAGSPDKDSRPAIATPLGVPAKDTPPSVQPNESAPTVEN